MKLKTKLLTTALLGSLSTLAHAEVSGYVTITSDYMFRGVSLNDKDAALQGGIDWAADESGWYAGIWASPVTDDTEVDLFAGYAGELGGGLEYDLMAVYYAYLDEDEYSYLELHAGLSKALSDNFSLGLNLDYTNDSMASNGYDDLDALHLSVVATYSIQEDMALEFEFGRQGWEVDGEDGDYNWGRASLVKDYEHFSVDVSAWYNDLDGDDSSKVSLGLSYHF
ncbi:TorF family putative porin [Bowmanella denitrificans]|uniref:TorF family putative porin n=1 Tax=Bowmanella denitrificans TaxID=366582 RepID=A0ABP3GUZ9_9ALTE|nr:TorF family putative porin [Bowmanella denitrificans]